MLSIVLHMPITCVYFTDNLAIWQVAFLAVNTRISQVDVSWKTGQGPIALALKVGPEVCGVTEALSRDM